MNKTLPAVKQNAIEIRDETHVPDEILDLIGDARFVLLGEASHGTHEFYKYRAEITERLICEKGFTAVAVEADFPDAYRVNRYVRGEGEDRNAEQALRNFERYPLWMWRNAEVSDFIERLRAHNDQLAPKNRVGFYGLDLYSLHASMNSVLEYLKKTDPKAAERARNRYSCFDRYGEDAQKYGYAASLSETNSCEDEAFAQLLELRKSSGDYLSGGGIIARDEFFVAEQNARLVKNAEEYYREMFLGDVSSWNLRDSHMNETLAALAAHLDEAGKPSKIVAWEHNSHLGDARATESALRGEWNVGQLARQQFGVENVCIIGFTTYIGTVTATSNWNEAAQLKKVRPAIRGSYEKLFHEAEIPRFFLNLRNDEAAFALAKPLLERAIGVIYRPQTERYSHYFKASLAEQFDGVIHFDVTKAVKPLDVVASWNLDGGDLPETFPDGI